MIEYVTSLLLFLLDTTNNFINCFAISVCKRLFSDLLSRQLSKLIFLNAFNIFCGNIYFQTCSLSARARTVAPSTSWSSIICLLLAVSLADAMFFEL